MLRKKSRERGPNPHSAVRYHKTYAYDKIRFTVLTASQMTKERQEMVAATLKTVTTGPEAMTLPETPGWSCTQIDKNSYGRAYVVAYLGIEVALFFKRQLTEIIPEPGEKVPEGVLQDPKEAWQRLDLLVRSAEKSNFVLTQTQHRLEESNWLLQSRVKDLDDLNDDLTKKLEVVGISIIGLTNKNANLERQLRAALRASKPASRLKTPGKSKGKRVSVRTTKPKRRVK